MRIMFCILTVIILVQIYIGYVLLDRAIWAEKRVKYLEKSLEDMKKERGRADAKASPVGTES